MKRTGELLKLVDGLSYDNVNNFRKLGFLHLERQEDGKRAFSEREALVLETAFPECKRGMKPSAAFAVANARYEQTIAEIRETIFGYTEDHHGVAPSVTKIERALAHRVTEMRRYITALVEEHAIVMRGGRVTVLSIFEPEGLLASTRLPRPAYLMLSQEKRTALREAALKLYLSQTESLPDNKKLPVPVEGLLERDGFSVEYRNLARGCFGYNDPSEKRVFLSREIEGDYGKRRLVLMHEYFHGFFGHGRRECAWENSEKREAEATYAAIHYLIPLHTFDAVIERWRLEDPKSRPPVEDRIANVYMVSPAVGSLYLEEQGERPRKNASVGLTVASSSVRGESTEPRITRHHFELR